MRGAPVGLTLTPVAVARTEGLPPPPVRLSLARMEYGSKTGTGTRRASGPLLFVVEAGTIDLYRNGEPTRLGPGAAALVQMNQRYAFVNDSSTPVTLLRLALSPPNATDKPVLDFIDITPTPSQVLTPPTRTWLFQGELLVLPSGPVDLFVVCATWASQPGVASTYQYSVPVGLNMLEGTLHIDDQAVLAADGCTLFAPQHAYRVRSGDGQSRGLLFGVLPMGQNLWLPPTGVGSDPPAPRDGVSCGDVP